MVSRDTAVHVVAVIAAVAILAGTRQLGLWPESGPAPVWVFLLYYGLILGGAHLYLAVRGEDGLVPVESRWRYVGTLAVLLVAGAAIFYGGGRAVGPVVLETLGSAVVVVTVAGYLLVESLEGYRASRST